MVDTRETTQSLCEEQAGIRGGDYLDYAWSSLTDFLNPYAADAELKPILGIPMEKYASVFIPEMMELPEDEMMEVDEKLMMLCDGETVINNKFYVLVICHIWIMERRRGSGYNDVCHHDAV